MTEPTSRDVIAPVQATTRDTGSDRTAATTSRDDPGATATHTGDGDRGGLPSAVYERYEPVRSLGGGGEAQVVMLVRDRASGQERVAKVYLTAIRPDPLILDALRDGDPAHVVPIVDRGDETDRFGNSRSWEVMDYLPEGSLATLLKTGPALTPEQVRRVVEEVRAALAYLHRELRRGDQVGVAHRDVKPENVLIRSRVPLDLVLCDFGLMAELRHTRRVTGRAGTPAYQAPETWWRKSQDPAQDWWSLGVLVVEMLTGQNPNTVPGGDLSEQDIFEHIAMHGVDLSGVTDPRWKLLCQGLLTKAPDERWGADEVRTWLDGGSPPVAAWSPMETPRAAAEPAAPPFEFAGRPCRTPGEVGVLMQAEWNAACDLFLDREAQLNLGGWVGDHFASLNLPNDMFRTGVGQEADASRRVARFISYVAPETPAVFRRRPADAAGLAVLAQAAAVGDGAAAAVVNGLDATLLRAFARHRCGHPGCGTGGCTVLEGAADRLSTEEAALDEMLTAASAGRQAPATAFHTADSAVGQVRPQAYAHLLRFLVAPETVGDAHALLRRQRGAQNSEWWKRIREIATTPGDRRATAATAVALALVPLAISDGNEQVAAAARERDARRADRRAGAAAAATDWRLGGAGQGRRVRHQVVTVLLALLMAYLTTYVVGATWALASFGAEVAGSRPDAVAGTVTWVQVSVAVPLLVLLACCLVLPAEPATAARTARRVALLLPIAAGFVLFATEPTLNFVVYPVVVQTGLATALNGLNGLYGGGFAIVAYAVALPLALFVGNRLVAIGGRGPVGGRPPSYVRTLKTFLVLAVIAIYLVRPVYHVAHWTLPGLPDPTQTWWLL